MSTSSGWLTLLVPDARSQRAVQETLSDWRDDVARATTLAARVTAHADGLLSFLYLAAGLIWDQSTSPDLWRCFLVTLMVAAGFVLAFAATVMCLDGPGPDATATASWLIAMTSSNAFAIVGATGVGSKEGRPAPVGAIVGLFFVFSFVMATWIVPALSSPYMHQILSTLPPDRIVPTPSTPLPLQMAYLAVPSTYYLMGAAVRRRLSARGWRARQAWALGAALAVVAVGVGARLVMLGSTTISTDRTILLRVIFLMNLVIPWSVIVWFARHSKESSPANLRR